MSAQVAHQKIKNKNKPELVMSLTHFVHHEQSIRYIFWNVHVFFEYEVVTTLSMVEGNNHQWQIFNQMKRSSMKCETKRSDEAHDLDVTQLEIQTWHSYLTRPTFSVNVSNVVQIHI